MSFGQYQSEIRPYFQAIIKEGLPLWLLASGLATKTAPPERDTFNGMFVPGGTDVRYCAWGLCRTKKFWGSDANVFRPERWFGVEKERLKEMDGRIGLIFGFGKHSCLGKGVAMIELNKVFVEVSLICRCEVKGLGLTLRLLRRFAFTVIDPTNPWKRLNFGVSPLYLRGENK
jgi:cytochrome P450